MLIVGLTGNIAAGKSAVAARWRTRGVTVIDSDQLAREVVAPGSIGLARVLERFGEGLRAADGTLDRAALRTRIFADPAERRALEALLHPLIEERREGAIELARQAGASLVVCDIPLLFEAHLEHRMDRIVLVDAAVAVRRERLMRDRALTPEAADAMIAAQWPAEAKRAAADHVIENEGSLAELERRADEVLRLLRAETSASA